jgi:hypothetical protein
MTRKRTEQQLFEEERRAWSLDQVKLFSKQLRKDVGGAWEWFTPRMREALVAQAAFVVARAQHKTEVNTDAMNQLLIDMERECGLRKEDEYP